MNELLKNSHKKAAWLFVLVAACMLMSNIAAATGSHWQKKCNVSKCDNALSLPLLIENGKRVGKVTVRYQNNRLKVEYQTKDGWYIKNTHLDVADNYNGLNVDMNDNPDIDAFPHQTKHFTPVKNVDYSLNASQWVDGTNLYIAAHADVLQKCADGYKRHKAKSYKNKKKHGKHKKVRHSKNYKGKNKYSKKHYSKSKKKHSSHKKASFYSKWSHNEDDDHNGKEQDKEDHNDYNHHDDDHDDDHHSSSHNKKVVSAWAKGLPFPGGAFGFYFIYKLDSCEDKPDSTVQFSDPIYSVVENDGIATITVLRDGDLSTAASVDYTTFDGSAKNGVDYEFTSGTLHFSANQSSAQFTVAIFDNDVEEPVKDFSLELSNAFGTDLGQQKTAMVEIENDDAAQPMPGEVRFKFAEYVVEENVGTALITVERINGSDGIISVDYATSNDTAIAGADYTATSGTLTFGDGVTEATFEVAIRDDNRFENEEELFLTLSNEMGTTIVAPNPVKLIILINDENPS